MNTRDVAISASERILREYLEDKFYTHSSKVREMLASEAFVEINSRPNAQEINLRLADLMGEMAREVYEEEKESVIAKSVGELRNVTGGLFSDAEMEELYAFISSPLGMKMARNFDIIGEAVGSGLKDLGIKILKRWNSSDTAFEIQKILEEIDEINS